MFKGKVFDLGRQGDGVLKHDGENIFIPGGLWGETVEYEIVDRQQGRLTKILDPCVDRVQPVCSFFYECGGCNLQHLNVEAYCRFKMKCLKELLKSAEIVTDFDDPVFIKPESRRRATFAFSWDGSKRRFGFNAKHSTKIVEINCCTVLVPELEKLIPALRSYLKDQKHFFPKKSGAGDIFVQLTDSGADILITFPFKPDLQWRQSAAVFSHENDIARISWRTGVNQEPEPVVMLHVPEIKIGDFILCPPAGAFLQPSVEGQQVLTQTVVEYAGKAKRICDLFCGTGTFALSLLKKKRTVVGVDNVSCALSALYAASSSRIKTHLRDLFETPLYPDELDGFDAVVFDPPRAGAKAQCEQLALSDVPRVIAVSCNPVTFIRDARILMQGGYRLNRLRPVDQFAFTPHMELVALFEK